MKTRYWILIIIAVCVLAFAYSSYADSGKQWGVSKHGSKCWRVDSHPANIKLVYLFDTETACKDFLKPSSGE